MRYIVFAVLLAVAFLVACQPAAEAPPPAPAAPPPPPPPAPEPEPEAALPEEEEEEEESFEGRQRFSDVVISEDDIICDAGESKLTFRFRNVDEDKTWQLNQEVPFPPPSGLSSVRVMINQYETNKRGGNYQGGELLFGPSELFSENCGGVEELGPGEEVTCTVYPVPLRGDTSYSSGLNEIFVNSAGTDGRVKFACE